MTNINVLKLIHCVSINFNIVRIPKSVYLYNRETMSAFSIITCDWHHLLPLAFSSASLLLFSFPLYSLLHLQSPLTRLELPDTKLNLNRFRVQMFHCNEKERKHFLEYAIF